MKAYRIIYVLNIYIFDPLGDKRPSIMSGTQVNIPQKMKFESEKLTSDNNSVRSRAHTWSVYMVPIQELSVYLVYAIYLQLKAEYIQGNRSSVNIYIHLARPHKNHPPPSPSPTPPPSAPPPASTPTRHPSQSNSSSSHHPAAIPHRAARSHA